MVKIDVKIKNDKHLRIDGVYCVNYCSTFVILIFSVRAMWLCITVSYMGVLFVICR
jgi:hypothetical protein